jgi:hypothetical protein
MYMGLDRNHGLSLVYPLSGDIGLTFAQNFCGFFLAEVVQNSFPNSLEAHNHWSRCCAPAWGSCADYLCIEVALKLRSGCVLFFAARVCGSARPPIC